MMQYFLFKTALPPIYLTALQETIYELFFHIFITLFIIGLVSTSGFVLYRRILDNNSDGNSKEEKWFNEHWNQMQQQQIQPQQPSSTLQSGAKIGSISPSTTNNFPKTTGERRKPSSCIRANVWLIPHPDKVDKGGEDSFFISADGLAIGVADGVGGCKLSLLPPASLIQD